MHDANGVTPQDHVQCHGPRAQPAACVPPYIVVKVALFGGLVRVRFGGLLLLEQLEPVLAALQLQQLDLKRRPPHQFDASNRP